MVSYMSLGEQVDADFSRARRKVLLHRLSAPLRGDSAPERLLCFEEIRRKLGATGGIRLGRRTVHSTNIAGSVGRCSEFDGAFLPSSVGMRTRWERIDRMFHRGEEMPPVSLDKIGNAYFVNDGNHRVSVARYHGVEWIDAEVTEFRAPLPKDQRRLTKGHGREETGDPRGLVARRPLRRRRYP